MLSGCPSAAFVGSSVLTDIGYHDVSYERLEQFDKTGREYSLAAPDDLF